MSDLFFDESFDFFEFEVTEKIQNKNLKNFLTSSLKLKNKILEKNDKIYISYIEELKIYQLFILKYPFKQFEFLIFHQLYDKNSQEFSCDLYIYDNFFCLYKNGHFYYFQNLKIEISIEEFITYLNNKFKIEIKNFRKIEKEEFLLLKQNYQKNPHEIKMQTISSQKNYAFNLYLFFIIFIISLILSTQNSMQESLEIKEESLLVDQIKKNYSFSFLEKKIVPLFESLNRNRLELIKFEYSLSDSKLIINTTSKTDIFNFLNENKKFINNSSLKYFEDKNIYEAIIYVQISK